MEMAQQPQQQSWFDGMRPGLQAAARMVLLGHEQRQAANALELRRIQRDRAAAEHACQAFAKAKDWNDTLAACQTIAREYAEANTGLWQDEIAWFARGQSEYNALVRDLFNGWNGAWPLAQANVAGLRGKGANGADWFQLFDRMAAAMAPAGTASSAQSSAPPAATDARAHTR